MKLDKEWKGRMVDTEFVTGQKANAPFLCISGDGGARNSIGFVRILWPAETCS